ncbi:MAG: acyl-CoA thioesterase II [Hyphomicrobiaceae bacterium]
MQDLKVDLVKLLRLEAAGERVFVGESPDVGWKRVYGGQVVAQALAAAYRTVDADVHVHSLHCYFLIGGDPRQPIRYEVEPLRDGRSFRTRRVVARQNGEAIFAFAASFHKEETAYDHQLDMPDVPMPEDLPDEREILARHGDRIDPTVRRLLERGPSLDCIEMRVVDYMHYVTVARTPPRQYVWLRARGDFPDDRGFAEAVLAYLSDWSLIETGLLPHGRLLVDPAIQAASLDHALWFHRPFKAGEWFLYAEDSPSNFGGLALARGQIFTRDGTLVASAAQEGLLRLRDPARKA